MDPGIIWNISLSLSALSLLMFGFLIVRRAWDELRTRKLAVRRRAVRYKIYMLLDLDSERFRRRCTDPAYFTPRERRLLHDECLALCQVIKGSDQERLIELMRRMHFHRDDLRDLRSAAEDLRYGAVVSLGYFNDARTRDALLAALGDRSDAVCLAAAHSLLALDALPPLAVLLERFVARGLLQKAACRTLFHRLARSKPALLREALARHGTDAGIRALVAEGMGHSSSYDVLPDLQQLCSDPVPLVRIEALHALMRLEHPSSVAAVLQRLDDEQTEVRAAAAHVAGELGIIEALPQLEKLLDAENWVLRFNTALALYRLGVAGRRVLLRRTRVPDLAGRTANLVLSEKGVASVLPNW